MELLRMSCRVSHAGNHCPRAFQPSSSMFTASAKERGNFSCCSASRKMRLVCMAAQHPRDMRINFGKYKGRMLGQLPSKYLHWMTKKLVDTDYHAWSKYASEVLGDHIYAERLEWEKVERILMGNSESLTDVPQSDDLQRQMAEQHGWDFSDESAWHAAKLVHIGTSLGGRIPRKPQKAGTHFGLSGALSPSLTDSQKRSKQAAAARSQAKRVSSATPGAPAKQKTSLKTDEKPKLFPWRTQAADRKPPAISPGSRVPTPGRGTQRQVSSNGGLRASELKSAIRAEEKRDAETSNAQGADARRIGRSREDDLEAGESAEDRSPRVGKRPAASKAKRAVKVGRGEGVEEREMGFRRDFLAEATSPSSSSSPSSGDEGSGKSNVVKGKDMQRSSNSIPIGMGQSSNSNLNRSMYGSGSGGSSERRSSSGFGGSLRGAGSGESESRKRSLAEELAWRREMKANKLSMKAAKGGKGVDMRSGTGEVVFPGRDSLLQQLVDGVNLGDEEL